MVIDLPKEQSSLETPMPPAPTGGPFPHADYAIAAMDDVLTPALAIYPDIVASNIQATLDQLNGDPTRWRPHVKTAKLQFVMEMLTQRGITHFKCATPTELRVACEAGAADVLVAFPAIGATAQHIRAIAGQFPAVRISALVDSLEQISQWQGSSIDLFIDIDPGMHRTGVSQEDNNAIIVLAKRIAEAGLRFGGLHYYDGHLCEPDLAQRTAAAHQGYRQLLNLCSDLQRHGISIAELVIGGTPTFPCVLNCKELQQSGLLYRVSPGTVVYADVRTLDALPPEFGYRPAAVVVARVVSRSEDGRITCDAGHKALSVDVGTPHGQVVGHPEFILMRPSEEHLPLQVPAENALPALGEALYLVPAHVCTTVHNFDFALLVRDGAVERVAPIEARGRGVPLLSKT
jgi:D-serine deaminase-like pyridoxal phosphate-dependent protein